MVIKIYDLNYIKTIHTHTHKKKTANCFLDRGIRVVFICLLPTILYFPNVLYNGQVSFISSEKKFFEAL